MNCNNRFCFYHIPEDHVDRQYALEGCFNGRMDFPDICNLRVEYDEEFEDE